MWDKPTKISGRCQIAIQRGGTRDLRQRVHHGLTLCSRRGLCPHLDLTRIVGMSHIHHMDVTKIIEMAGGASKLARLLGLHHTTVLGWSSVPPKHVPAVAALLEVGRHEIRPDLWEKPPSEPARAA